jgi:polysaccharide export outer membrane protein
MLKQRMTEFLSLMLMAGCCAPALTAQQPKDAPLTVARATDDKQTSAAVDASRPVAHQRNPRYKINRDDILSVSFPLSPEFNQKVQVQPDGYVTLLGGENILVQGLTVPEISESVKKAYAGTLHNPIIDVDLVDFQKPMFTALGQVGKPGQYELRTDLTVTQAIALAGGFSSTAKTQVLLYRPVNSTWAEVRSLNIKEILQGKNISEDVHLQPGDMVFVPEKFITKFRKYVPYAFGMTMNPSAAIF